jgi:hypothetical protein
MHPWLKSIAFLFLMGMPFWIEGQAEVLPSNYKGTRVPVFEKIYVRSSQLVHKPDGLYCYDDNDQEIKVKTLLCDKKGTYVLRVRYQCTLCGKTYLDRLPEGEEGCPIYEYEIFPGIWSKK